MRPAIVGGALQQIGKGPKVLSAMFDILATQKILEGSAKTSIFPPKSELLSQLLASKEGTPPTQA